MKNRGGRIHAARSHTPDRPAVTAQTHSGTAKVAAGNRIVRQSEQNRAAARGQGLTLTEARRLLRDVFPQEWDALEGCCDGDPYARCTRGLAAALAELNQEQVGTVYARLVRARARLRAWVGNQHIASGKQAPPRTSLADGDMVSPIDPYPDSAERPLASAGRAESRQAAY